MAGCLWNLAHHRGLYKRHLKESKCWHNAELQLGKEQNDTEIQQLEVACGDWINPSQPNCDPLSYLVNNQKLQLARSSAHRVNTLFFSLRPKDKQTGKVPSVDACKQPSAASLAFIEV